MLLIFLLIEGDVIDIISSDIITYENDKNPYEERKIFVSSVIGFAKTCQID